MINKLKQYFLLNVNQLIHWILAMQNNISIKYDNHQIIRKNFCSSNLDKIFILNFRSIANSDFGRNNIKVCILQGYVYVILSLQAHG